MSFTLRNILFMFAFVLLATAAGAQLSNDDCLGCHGDATADKPVDAAAFAGSVHGSLSCSDCHGEIKDYPHEPKPAAVDCGGCHGDMVEQWKNSRHAKAFMAGNRDAAGCLSCHGRNAHKILPKSDPKSPTAHANVPKTCAGCHAQKLVMERSHLTAQPVFSYQQSVHGKAVAGGNGKAAVCTDCHNAHEVLGANDAKSPIFKFNIPQTCGKCHGSVTEVFNVSVHGKAIAHGNDKAPVCTDCHGIHAILPHIDPTSSVAAQNIARTTCGQCHGNVQIAREFGISAGRIRSYEESYHGLAKRLGSAEAANCASCHGVHNILPQEDPKSTIHKANLVSTCGRCHPGAGDKFVQGRVHLEELPVEDQQFSDKAVKWVSWIYVPLIILTLGGMALHNIIIWVKKARKARKDPTRTVERMNRTQRIQHFLLVLSFFTLVVTGFALAWPDSFFATITFGEGVRRIVHRVAAVVMLLVGAYHVWYMVFTKEGRQGLKDFWFSFKDAKDAAGVMKYYLGLSRVHPKMGRFTYAEKAEYWALVWGTIVMGVTGLMLWFEVQVSSWLNLPRWWVDVALLIHFYEAILATLAIIIWHLYAVIFDPDVYPVSWTWYDGKMREGQFRHEHELEWEKQKNEQQTTES
ncbi:MAG TPA: cytochrome b/b6 domain-containing protein [Thermoanaerobaculia bacterium]